MAKTRIKVSEYLTQNELMRIFYASILSMKKHKCFSIYAYTAQVLKIQNQTRSKLIPKAKLNS